MRIADQLRRLTLETPYDTTIVTTERAGESKTTAYTVVQAGKIFRSGSGEIRTRDLLLRSGDFLQFAAEHDALLAQ